MKYLFCFLFIYSSITVFSQSEIKGENARLVQELSSTKSKLESRFQLKSVYKIQVFSGSIQQAKKVKNDYNQLALDFSSMIFYESPNYKVWVGSFRTKLDADRAFLELKNDFPHAFVFQPGR
ncbi:MAG: SPOR domain-containing protein [Psychroflexus halocasei]